jgi:hypothetical protein
MLCQLNNQCQDTNMLFLQQHLASLFAFQEHCACSSQVDLALLVLYLMLVPA